MMFSTARKLPLMFFVSVFIMLLTIQTEKTFFDTATNMMQAELYSEGKTCLNNIMGEQTSVIYETVQTGSECWMSKYHPGTALWAAPFYKIFDDAKPFTTVTSENETILLPSLWVGNLAAAIAVIVGLSIFIRHAQRSVVTKKHINMSIIVLFLGTSIWGVASTQLWMHSVNTMLLIGASTSLLEQKHFKFTVYAGLSILVRPMTGLLYLPFLVHLMYRKEWKKLGMSASGIGVGSFFALLYSKIFFGSWSPDAGYSLEVKPNVSNGSFSYFNRFFREGVSNYLEGLFSIHYGMLFISPIIGYLMFLAFKHRQKFSLHSQILFGGILYLFVLWALNRASGGYIRSYRYPLESIAFMLPVLAAHIPNKPSANKLFIILATWSVIQQIYRVLFLSQVSLIHTFIN